MTTKTKKNTNKSNNIDTNNNIKPKVPKNIEKQINELKKLQTELDDCMYSNCKYMSKKELTNMMDKCKKKTEHIVSLVERNSQKNSCMFDFFIKKSDKLDKMYKCVNDKCSTQNKKTISKGLKLSNMINPDMKKIKGLRNKINKLNTKKKECYNTQCKNTFPDSEEVFINCYKKTNKITNKLTAKARSAKLKECLKPFNYYKKIKELHKCQEEKCKSISDKVVPEVNSMYNEIMEIMTKTTELSAKYAEYMPERII